MTRSIASDLSVSIATRYLFIFPSTELHEGNYSTAKERVQIKRERSPGQDSETPKGGGRRKGPANFIQELRNPQTEELKKRQHYQVGIQSLSP